MEMIEQGTPNIEFFINEFEKEGKGVRGLGPLYYLLRVVGLRWNGARHVLVKSVLLASALTLVALGAYFYGDYYLVNNYSNLDTSWRDISEYEIWYYVVGAWLVLMTIYWIAGVPTLKFVNDQVQPFYLPFRDIDGFDIDIEIESTSLRPPVHPRGTLKELLNGLGEDEVRRLGKSTFAYIILASVLCSLLTVVEGYLMYIPHFDNVGWGAAMLANRFVWAFVVCMVALPWYAIFAMAMVLMEHKIKKIHVLIQKFFDDTLSKSYTDFDYITGHRQKLSAFADGLSRRFWRLAFWSVAVCAIASVGFTFRAIQMDVEEIGQLAYIFISVVLLGFVIYVLSFASLVYSSSRFNFRFLNEIRGRFPIRETYDSAGVNMFNNILRELESFVYHCKVNPIGFRLHNLYVTPQMVKAIIYTLLSIISIFFQLRFGNK